MGTAICFVVSQGVPRWHYPRRMTWLRKFWFAVGMVMAVALSLWWPQPGNLMAAGGATTAWTIAIVFLCSGLSLPGGALRKGLRAGRLHGLIELCIFVITPAFFLMTSFWMEPGLRTGVLALGCLPTTITSCVIFTQRAGGNTAAALFNAVVSNLSGVFLAPILLSLLLQASGQGLGGSDLWRVFRDLTIQVLLPFALGRGLHALSRGRASRYAPVFSAVNSWSILLILYLTFSRAGADGTLGVRLAAMPLPIFYLATSYLLLSAGVWWACKPLGLNRADSICALMTAPQKTLALGVPLLSTFFKEQPALLASALLPILAYHPFQLFFAGVIAHNLSPEENPGAQTPENPK